MDHSVLLLMLVLAAAVAALSVAARRLHLASPILMLVAGAAIAFIPGVPNQNLRKPYFSKYGWTQSVSYYCNCANSSYDAFQAKVEMRNWHGYTLIANYNYQYARGDSANSYTFLYNRPLGYGNQPTISRQQFLVNQVANLPFGRGRTFGLAAFQRLGVDFRRLVLRRDGVGGDGADGQHGDRDGGR